MEEVKWQMTGNDPNDLIARMTNGDVLRVEKMRKGNYWWCAYVSGNDFHSYGKYGKTLGEAKKLCEEEYWKQKNKADGR